MVYNVLVLGASYGSLFATKLLMAGHRATLVCTRSTADLINREGTIVRMPIKGRDGLLDISSKKLPGTLSAATPDAVDPGPFDLVVLGMQEAQYGASGVRELMSRVAQVAQAMPRDHEHAAAAVPEAHTRTVDGRSRGAAMRIRRVWKDFDPALVTLASPDPQAFRPPDQPKNVLQVGLPTNFKAARFDGERADRTPSQPRSRHRSGSLRRRRRPDRSSGEAQGARVGLRAAGQMADADRRQLPLHPPRRDDSHQGRRARRRRASHATVYDWVSKLCTAWAPKTRTSFRSRNTPRPPRVSVNRRLPRGRCSVAPNISNASIASSGASPGSRACNPPHLTRSSHSSTSGSEGTAPLS